MKKCLFWTVYGLVLAAATLAGLELIAVFLTPPWPAYDLRPIEASAASIARVKALANRPDLIPNYNGWGLWDRERTLDRPANVHFRSLLVGDSFLEGAFTTAPLSDLVERDWAAHGVGDSEAINLGVSATGPIQYYYRIKRVGLRLQPDAILELFYPGNDFVSDRLSSWSIPPLVAERPEPSLLGAVAPRLDWLIVNRLGLSEFGRGNKPVPNEFDTLNDVGNKPRNRRASLLADYLHKNYFPDKSTELMREILERGGDAFWAPFEQEGRDPEFLQGWLVASMIEWETGTWPVPHDSVEADHMVDTTRVDATLSWLVGADKLAEENGITFLIAVAPMASVDPRYTEFWKPWPRFYSVNLEREADRRRLLAALRSKGLHVIDLAADLEGVRGTYRLTDGHWTALGTSIAAKRIAAELIKVRDRRLRDRRTTGQ